MWNEALLHPLLLLHAPVLEPDFDLGLVQLQGPRYLYPTRPGQVLVEMELLFQLGQLLGGEVGPAGVVDSSGTPAQASAPTAGTMTTGVHPVTSVTRGTRLRN